MAISDYLKRGILAAALTAGAMTGVERLAYAQDVAEKPVPTQPADPPKKEEPKKEEPKQEEPKKEDYTLEGMIKHYEGLTTKTLEDNWILTDLYTQNKQADKAKQTATTALTNNNPTTAIENYYTSKLQTAAGDAAKGQESFQKALQTVVNEAEGKETDLTGKDEKYFYNLAIREGSTKRKWLNAIILHEKAGDIKKNNPLYSGEIATAYRALSKGIPDLTKKRVYQNRAIVNYTTSLELSETNEVKLSEVDRMFNLAICYFGRGLTFKDMGNKDSAIRDLQAVQKYDTGKQYTTSVEKNLKELNQK
jgi:tetratricopeptide (TPR) repeat protein